MCNNNEDGWSKEPINWEKIDKVDDTFKKTESLYFKNIQELEPIIENIEGIFVLAGGVKENGEVHEWVKRRLDLAYHIYCLKEKSVKIFCLGGGTYHKCPVLNKNNFVIHESTACAKYLMDLGTTPTDIYKEIGSYDTIANGYFGIVNFIIPLKLENIVIVSSDFHMERAKTIFNWLLDINNINCQVKYLPVSDEGLPQDIVQSRREREKTSLKNLKLNVIEKIDTLPKFVKWFYEDHKAYSCHHEESEMENISDTIKKSY